MKRLSVLLAVLLTAAIPAAAQESSTESGTPEESVRRNSIGLFMGATLEADEEGAFTIGLDYERRLGAVFGIGVLADKPFGGARSSLLLGGLFWHPVRQVRLDVAPGIEINQGESEEFVLRLGADYDFEIRERWSIAPNVNLDFVDGRTVWVIGAELGYSF
jgi:hypothetical protein